MNIDDRKGRFIFSILIRTRDSPFFIRYQRRVNFTRYPAVPRPIHPATPFHPALLPHLPSSVAAVCARVCVCERVSI
jgi:hypothetical protein